MKLLALLERIAVALESDVALHVRQDGDLDKMNADAMEIHRRNLAITERQVATAEAHVALHMKAWQDAHPGREPWTIS